MTAEQKMVKRVENLGTQLRSQIAVNRKQQTIVDRQAETITQLKAEIAGHDLDLNGAAIQVIREHLKHAGIEAAFVDDGVHWAVSKLLQVERSVTARDEVIKALVEVANRIPSVARAVTTLAQTAKPAMPGGGSYVAGVEAWEADTQAALALVRELEEG